MKVKAGFLVLGERNFAKISLEQEEIAAPTPNILYKNMHWRFEFRHILYSFGFGSRRTESDSLKKGSM